METFEQEQAQTEAALNEEQVITATVLKVTPQYVLVDIGYKSEGVVPVSEFTDHEGNVTIQRGDEIAVMREPGSTEEGYINLSHQKAQRLRSWDEVEKAYAEKVGHRPGHRSHQGRPGGGHRRARVPAGFAG